MPRVCIYSMIFLQFFTSSTMFADSTSNYNTGCSKPAIICNFSWMWKLSLIYKVADVIYFTCAPHSSLMVDTVSLLLLYFVCIFFYSDSIIDCDTLNRTCYPGENGDYLLSVRCNDGYDACDPNTNVCFYKESCVDLPYLTDRLCTCPPAYEGDGYTCTGGKY